MQNVPIRWFHGAPDGLSHKRKVLPPKYVFRLAVVTSLYKNLVKNTKA
jgi:hypothetical protein